MFHCSLNYAGVTVTLTLFCTRHTSITQRNVSKAGNKRRQFDDVMVLLFPVMVLLFPVFSCFNLKENLLNIWCKIKIYFTRDHWKSYCYIYNYILLSMITREINFFLTPTFNKYPLYNPETCNYTVPKITVSCQFQLYDKNKWPRIRTQGNHLNLFGEYILHFKFSCFDDDL